MEEKLSILLKQIKYDDLNKSSFNGGKIKEIKGNRNRDSYCFYIELESPLSVDAYLEFKEKLPLGFPTIKSVSFKFELKNYVVDNIKEYITLFMNEYTKENPLLSIFKDNKYDIDVHLVVAYGVKISEVVNEVSKRIAYEANKKYGNIFGKVNVYVDDLLNL